MTGDTAIGMQLDDELEGSPERAAAVFAENMQKNLRTCQPGIVRSYDETTQTATVQATIRRLVVGQGFVDLPLCVDVPVLLPAGGDFVQTFPVRAGDEGILLFSDRAIDFWWDRGGVQDPSEYRLHDLSDGLFIPGLSSRPRFLTGVATDATELRTRDGTTVFRLETGAISAVADVVNVGAATGTQATILGETYRPAEDTLLDALDTFLAVVVLNFTGVTTLTQVATAVNSLGPAAIPLRAAIAAFKAGGSGYLTTKAKVI